MEDANRVSRFEYFIQRLQDQRDDQRIKAIVTVRDYALAKIQDAAREYGVTGQIELSRLKDEEIEALVAEEFGR